MSIRLTFSFLKWLVYKSFEHVLGLHRSFLNYLDRYPSEAIFLWFVCSIMLYIPVAIVSLLNSDTMEGWAWTTGLYWLSTVMYFGVSVIRVLFSKFQDERQDIFDRLKRTE